MYRQAKILNLYTLPDAGVYTFDLNVVDPISQLWFFFTATNGATDNVGVSLPECILSIEILDGSDVIYSMSGIEAFGWATAYLGQMPLCYVDERPNMWNDFSMMIPFGRYLGDPDYAFDPTRFTNPQCRITTNLAAVNAIGALGFVTGTLQVTCLADVLENGARPSGFIMAKENYAFVSAAAGVTYVDLPTDYPYLGLLFRTYAAGVWMATDITDVKLQCDQNKYIPFDLELEDFRRHPRWQNPRMAYGHHFHLANAQVAVSILKMDERAEMAVLVGGESEAKYITTGVGQAPIVLQTAGAADPVDRNIAADIRGYFPYGCIWIPLGNIADPSDYFPAPSFNSVRLELTNGGAGANCAVCTIQDRPY